MSAALLNAAPTPTAHLVFGPQGAGKSTLAAALAQRERAVVFSIDAWMMALYGPDLPQPDMMAWVLERVARCESRILDTAQAVALRGVPVVLDLGLMRAADRQRIATLAQQAGLTVFRHYVSAAPDVRRARIAARNHQRGPTFSFNVTPQMFDAMETRFESPDSAELSLCVTHPVEH